MENWKHVFPPQFQENRFAYVPFPGSGDFETTALRHSNKLKLENADNLIIPASS